MDRLACTNMGSEMEEAKYYMKWFVEILEGCDTNWVETNDEVPGLIFDLILEFDTDVFLKFKNNCLVSEETYEKSVLLYEKIENLCRTENWTKPFSHTEKERKDIINLTKEVKSLLRD